MDTFDFARPASLPAAQVDALRASLEGPTTRIGMLLGSRLRLPVTMTLAGVGPAEASLVADDRSLFTCSVRSETIVISGLATFVCELADVVMGGPGLVADRSPSALELRLVATHLGPSLRDVAGSVVAELTTTCVVEAWNGETPPPVTGTVALDVELTIGDTSGVIVIAVPASMLGVDTVDTVDVDLEGTSTNPLMLDALSDVPVALAVRFDPVRVAAEDLDRLDVGDVIRLEHPAERPLMALVNNQPMFLARPGRHGRAMAIRVEHVIDEVTS